MFSISDVNPRCFRTLLMALLVFQQKIWSALVHAKLSKFPSYRLSLWISHNWDTVIKHFTEGPFVQKHNFSKKEDVVPRCSVFGTSKDICCWTDRSSWWIRYLCMLCIMHVRKTHCMLTFCIKNSKYSLNQDAFRKPVTFSVYWNAQRVQLTSC